MTRHLQKYQPVAERFISLLVLAILLMFTYAFFFQSPYAGFDWNPSDGQIWEVFATGGLQPGDQLVKIGQVEIANFRRDLRLTLFDGVQRGDVVPLVVQRGGQPLVILWTLPGFSTAELWNRLSSQWWLAFVFWAFGQATRLHVRPRDARWRTLLIFNFLTAIWLSASTLSRTHIGFSAIVLRSALWMSAPVYLHLHWLFPKSLSRLPSIVTWMAYVAAVCLAGLEWFHFLPANAYVAGFLLALGGSALLLAIHFIFRPTERRDVALPVLGGALALGLPAILGVVVASDQFSEDLQTFLVTLAALPILPATYFYAVYRRQVGGLELRANRLIALYLFSIPLGITLIIAVPLVDQWLDFPGDSQVIAILSAALIGVSVAFGFAPFQRLIERHILRIPLPPSDLLETYAARITVSLNEQRLASLLRDEILPSLLIRQSALIRLEGAARVAYVHGLDANDLPSPADTERLLSTAGRFRAPADSLPSAWVRLALRLTAENKLLGLWLLGRRDPDDLYGAQDIAVLTSLANQTAMALTNISQAESLRALYQEDIAQTENQRTHLARELHDNLLNELARLETIVDEQAASPEYLALCESLIATVRQTISDLRPDALNYGLYPALESLADNLAERQAAFPVVAFRVAKSAERYNASVELHVYRIVQQACDNALKHASPRALTLAGELRADRIDLQVEDDGKGFSVGDNGDVARLAAHKHFGLAGMLERAAIIGAEVNMDSAPGQGTRIRIYWPSVSQ